MPVIFDRLSAKQWLEPVFGPSDATLAAVLARVQFNENGIFHDVLLPEPTHSFAIEGDAVEYILAMAKKWVDKSAFAEWWGIATHQTAVM